MTSETKFASGYSSVWREITPLSDGYWAIENMLTRRVVEPLQNRAPKDMRGLVNELAFIGFSKLANSSTKPSSAKIIETLKAEVCVAVDYINRVSSAENIKNEAVDAACIHESALICERLLNFFPSGTKRIIRPQFKGCGIISSCEGDVQVGENLYEVKAGDRSFRVSDIRQLLTYAALAYSSDSLSFSRIGLFNPRTGMAWAKSLDEVCIAISGTKANDVLPRVIEHMQSTSIYR
ncbi:hypothetical protein [Hydrogenophaga sp.]|uniref:hypothetical protein n=1 Tax=Hydrogenophaga sp. TaxID=1904254 RepID=UPI00273714A5|nr:hypothetical protein [Hydrogenophaga sp.]MDP3886205.1 hypothetical protein [Hydrogenophaga sp.]